MAQLRLSRAMSGWQRIGVVISVLWLVGLPIYLQMHENQRIYNLVMNCIDARLPGDAAAGATFDQVLQYCTRVYGPYWSWGELVRLFRDDVFVFVWFSGFLLAPIVLFWLVDWIVLSTVRWVRRGFTGPGR
jgi:hypothetical protein